MPAASPPGSAAGIPHRSGEPHPPANAARPAPDVPRDDVQEDPATPTPNHLPLSPVAYASTTPPATPCP